MNSRRNFLKLVGAGAAGAALGGTFNLLTKPDGFALLEDYAIGHKSHVFVSGMPKHIGLGCLLKIDDRHYTIIECGAVSGGRYLLMLDRPLEKGCGRRSSIEFIEVSETKYYVINTPTLRTRPLQDLTKQYLEPAAKSLAKKVDEEIIARVAMQPVKGGTKVTLDIVPGFVHLHPDLQTVMLG